MRTALKQTAKNLGYEVEVILAGLSNIYTSYITTPEEYQVQRYEGASTIYGPHTLTIYLHQYQKLLSSIYSNVVLEEGPNPPYLDDKQINLNTGVIFSHIL
jgi:neutral ceramidase